VCVCVCVCLCVWVCMCVWVWVCMCVYLHMNISILPLLRFRFDGLSNHMRVYMCACVYVHVFYYTLLWEVHFLDLSYVNMNHVIHIICICSNIQVYTRSPPTHTHTHTHMHVNIWKSKLWNDTYICIVCTFSPSHTCISKYTDRDLCACAHVYMYK